MHLNAVLAIQISDTFKSFNDLAVALKSKYAGFCSNVSQESSSIILEFGSSKTIKLSLESYPYVSNGSMIRLYAQIEYTDLVNKRRYEKYRDNKRDAEEAQERRRKERKESERQRKMTKELNIVL